MKGKTKLAATIIIFSMLFLACSAQTISVKTSRPDYTIGDEIAIINTVKNTASEKKGLVIETAFGSEAPGYAPKIVQSGAPFEALEEKEIIFNLSVTETMPAGKYFVESILREKGKDNVLEQATASFEVKGTLKTIGLELLSCKTQDCTGRSTLFYKGNKVFLDYRSSVGEEEGLTVKSTLVSPEGAEKEIALPYNFTIESSGAFFLKATASKEGYKTESKEIEFGGLDEEIKLIENRPAQPGGSKPAGTTAEGGNTTMLIVAAIAVLAVGVGIAYFKFFGKKQKHRH
ncbi:MAG: hypothetical protein NTW59_00505 [Candidatus Diapherotrites archaeon]|nr:hypothetical protein [Candidatus Diapherotrites archaeon]